MKPLRALALSAGMDVIVDQAAQSGIAFVTLLGLVIFVVGVAALLVGDASDASRTHSSLPTP